MSIRRSQQSTTTLTLTLNPNRNPNPKVQDNSGAMNAGSLVGEPWQV